MKTFIRIIAVVLVLSALFFMKTRSSDDSVRVYRVSDGKTISYNEMISEVRNASLIFTGEIHTDQEHHRLELDIIKSLNKAKVPIAVGFEMFRADSQKYLDQWVKGVLPFDDFVRVYYRNWNMPWPLYGNILMYLRQEDIPAIGLNVPEGIARKVNTDGFSSLTQDERRMLPPGISCSVDEKYMEFIQRAYREHSHGGGRFVYFCEAQMLWNKTMAWNLVGYLKGHPRGVIVVVTGAGHAWKRGIPEQVTVLSEKTRYKVILPEVPGYIEPKNITSADADYIVLKS
jgi:uncharacterized iron-regulated protein